jgi:hypothetical protein
MLHKINRLLYLLPMGVAYDSTISPGNSHAFRKSDEPSAIKIPKAEYCLDLQLRKIHCAHLHQVNYLTRSGPPEVSDNRRCCL